MHYVSRAIHPEDVRLAGHHLAELGFGTAERFGDHNGDVVG
jgi:hypothetical protein